MQKLEYNGQSHEPTLPGFLTALAQAVDEKLVIEGDVEQALFRRDDYTVGCPISEAVNGRPNVLIDWLDNLASELYNDGNR